MDWSNRQGRSGVGSRSNRASASRGHRRVPICCDGSEPGSLPFTEFSYQRVVKLKVLHQTNPVYRHRSDDLGRSSCNTLLPAIENAAHRGCGKPVQGFRDCRLLPTDCIRLLKQPGKNAKNPCLYGDSLISGMVQILARFKSRSHLPDGIGFSKLPVSSMMGWFVPTKTVSRRKQTWIARLLRTSRSRNAISLRSPAQSRPLRYMSVFRVPPSDCCLSRGKAWPSRCSPELKRSPSWPGNTRSAGSSSINRFTPPRRLSAKPSHPQVEPTTSFSTCRSPRLGCGNWSWLWC